MKVYFRKKQLISILFVVSLAFAGIFCFSNFATVARADENVEDEEVSFEDEEKPETHYVTIFDQSSKFTVKTDAETVADVLELAGIILSSSDSTEPSLNEKINADNFFVNIYRSRPVIISDGLKKVRIMTSSYDSRLIAEQAGFVIYDGDEIILEPNDRFLEAGIASSYKIIRGDGATLTISEEIPFSEKVTKDYTIPAGTKIVEQYGEVGLKNLTYAVKTANGVEISRELISETIVREPVDRLVTVGANQIERTPLTAMMGRNRYTVENSEGKIIERQETFYDLPMSKVMKFCGKTDYTVREDGVKVDEDGYVLVAANLDRYPRCSIVETSLGLGKVYDTGTFAIANPEQFDLATDWTNHNGR